MTRPAVSPSCTSIRSRYASRRAEARRCLSSGSAGGRPRTAGPAPAGRLRPRGPDRYRSLASQAWPPAAGPVTRAEGKRSGRPRWSRTSSPVAEQQGGVRGLRLVGRPPPHLRLELVAEVADVAEVEVERQPAVLGIRPRRSCAVQVVEDCCLIRSGARPATDQDLAVGDAVAGVLGERPAATAQEGETRQLLYHRAAVQPEALLRTGEQGFVSGERLR